MNTPTLKLLLVSGLFLGLAGCVHVTQKPTDTSQPAEAEAMMEEKMDGEAMEEKMDGDAMDMNGEAMEEKMDGDAMEAEMDGEAMEEKDDDVMEANAMMMDMSDLPCHQMPDGSWMGDC